MHRYKDHFLDSCVIIGRILDFDSQNNYAIQYFSQDHTRHTSKRVENEIKGRLNGIRRELLSFFNWIETKNFRGMPTDINIMGFLRKYKLQDWDRNWTTINRFYAKYMEQIKSYLIDKKDSTVDSLRTCVINAISKAENKLICMLYDSTSKEIHCHLTPIDYLTIYHTEYINVNNVINYQKDALILLDSYYVKNIVVKKELGFITTDIGDIISKLTDIQNYLPGIYIFNMRIT